jgi:hypothetical protein
MSITLVVSDTHRKQNTDNLLTRQPMIKVESSSIKKILIIL